MNRGLIIGVAFALLVVLVQTVASQGDEIVLRSADIPVYPALARQARIEGSVKIVFTLPASGSAPANVEVVAGHVMLKQAAIENVRTWRFDSPYAVERKYETTFKYRLSGVDAPAPARTKVIFDSFQNVEIVSDVPLKEIIVN